MLPFATIYFFASLAALVAATYTDMRERLVSDKITGGLAALAILLRALESYSTASPEPLIMGFAGGIVGFAAAYALYRIGAWAGGDVKLVTALAIANPVNYAIAAKAIGAQGLASGIQALPVFAIELILCSALMVFPLGMAMSIAAAFKHRKVIRNTAESVGKKTQSLLGAAVLLTGARLAIEWMFDLASLAKPFAADAIHWKWFYSAGVSYTYQYSQAFVPLKETLALAILLAASMLPRKSAGYVAFTFAIAGFALAPIEFTAGAAVVAVPLIAAYALWKLYAESRETAFKETIRTKNAEEGMIPDKVIVRRNGRIAMEAAPSIKTVINQLISNRMKKALGDSKIEGRVLASPNEAGGLSKEVAEEMRGKAAKGLAPATITVRKTMAFVPAILAAYVALQLFGDFIWKIVFGMI